MREIKKPNLNAPRFRPQVKQIITNELINNFKKKFKVYKDVSPAVLKNIIKTFHEKVYMKVIDNRDGIELPESVAILFIASCPPATERENTNYKKSKEYGVSVTNKNWETDGKLAKICNSMFGVKYQIKNRQFWTFIACRKFKRAVAKSYPENWKKYVDLQNMKKINWEHKKAIVKNFNKNKASALAFNSFDI